LLIGTDVELLLDEDELEEEDEDDDVVEELTGVAIPDRGVKFTPVLSPVPATAAYSARVQVLLTSIAITSTTTSARGLSRLAISFSTSAMVSDSARTTIAF
jgi:hypothetical protein